MLEGLCLGTESKDFEIVTSFTEYIINQNHSLA